MCRIPALFCVCLLVCDSVCDQCHMTVHCATSPCAIGILYCHVQLDHFTLDLGKQNLGRIHTLDIGFATHQTMGGKLGSLFGKAWNLQMVEVAHLNAPGAGCGF